MRHARTARIRLDQRLNSIKAIEISRPHRGWIRAIREALGMSTTELAMRMELSQQSIVSMEQRELRSTIQLDTLERAARAMDCDLVYAIVPRTSLEEIVQARSHEKARQLIVTVGHHSRLEGQEVSDADVAVQIEQIAAELVDRRGLWRDNGDQA